MKDWRLQVAFLGGRDEWWVNKVGTFTDGQCPMVRLAALLLRVLRALPSSGLALRVRG